MREHQIIINLKPEHYRELERLSRLAGAHSVSLFAKERILASIDNEGVSLNHQPKMVDEVAIDIRRLQRELQIFVAESLSRKDFGYIGTDQSISAGNWAETSDMGAAVNITPSTPDDLEELAERAFAISPRLGAFENLDDETPLFSDPLDELLGAFEATQGEVASQSLERAGSDADATVTVSQDISQDMSQDMSKDSPPLSGGPPPRRRRT